MAVAQRLARAEQRADAWYRAASEWKPVALFFLLFVGLWAPYQIVSTYGLGLHPDLVELYDWSRHPSASYYKHPPLAAWIVGLWFRLFPARDWAFHLLAATYASAALVAIYGVARLYLPQERARLALVLLLLTPFYQFLSERFSPNQVLLLAWPLATYCFVRAFRSRSVAWSAAAGIAAALAMLGKYYSIYLIGAFIVAAMVHADRLRYLKSSSPWISVAVGTAALAPHLHWLYLHDFQPFHYAVTVHGPASYLVAVRSAANYLAGAFGYVVLLLAAYSIVARPSAALLRDALWPADQDRRMLVVLLGAQILLAPLSAVVFGLRITSLWTMQAWFLLPVMLLAPPAVNFPAPARAKLALLALAFAVVCVALAPLIAAAQFRRGTKSGNEYFSSAVRALEQGWREQTAAPLRIVAGEPNLSAAASFYAASHPDALPHFDLTTAPWLNADRLRKEGWAALCRADDAPCVAAAESQASAHRDTARGSAVVAPEALGLAAPPRRFAWWIVPPAGD